MFANDPTGTVLARADEVMNAEMSAMGGKADMAFCTANVRL